MITLLANGCSHTAGAEIRYPLQDKCYINAWPRWLADDMGWDWVNLPNLATLTNKLNALLLNG